MDVYVRTGYSCTSGRKTLSVTSKAGEPRARAPSLHLSNSPAGRVAHPDSLPQVATTASPNAGGLVTLPQFEINMIITDPLALIRPSRTAPARHLFAARQRKSGTTLS